jgi:hypothetical protein
MLRRSWVYAIRNDNGAFLRAKKGNESDVGNSGPCGKLVSVVDEE